MSENESDGAVLAEKQKIIDAARKTALDLQPETLCVDPNIDHGGNLPKMISVGQFEHAVFSSSEHARDLLSYEEARGLLTAWAKQHNVYYYARDKESFSEDEAARLAKEQGCQFVIVEDLS